MVKNKRQKARFGLVGSMSTAIDFGLLFLFRSFGLPSVAANVISTTTAFLFSFTANKKYTFKTQGTNVKRELMLFTIVTLFGLWVIQSIVIWLLEPRIEALGVTSNMSLLAAKLIATGVTLVWNYYLYSRVVFKDN